MRIFFLSFEFYETIDLLSIWEIKLILVAILKKLSSQEYSKHSAVHLLQSSPLSMASILPRIITGLAMLLARLIIFRLSVVGWISL